MAGFQSLAENVLIGAANLQSQFDQRSVDLKLVLEGIGQELSIEKQLQLIEYLKNRGWVDGSDSTHDMLRMRVTGEGQVEAERLVEHKRIERTIESSTHVFPVPPNAPKWRWRREINWTKWGAIGALLAIPTMILLWWSTK